MREVAQAPPHVMNQGNKPPIVRPNMAPGQALLNVPPNQIPGMINPQLVPSMLSDPNAIQELLKQQAKNIINSQAIMSPHPMAQV